MSVHVPSLDGAGRRCECLLCQMTRRVEHVADRELSELWEAVFEMAAMDCRDRYRETLQKIADHGELDGCDGNCALWMSEVAEKALAGEEH